MATDSLEIAIAGIRSVWGPLNTDVIAGCRGYLENLLKAPATEEWLAALHREVPANKGLYRPPHDHGKGWVIYAVQEGEIEMRTYAWVEAPDGSVQLVRRDSTLVRPGQVQVYLPGDIHDTRCVSGPALLYRFAERDLKKEDKEAHRVTRYVERDGSWTVASS